MNLTAGLPCFAKAKSEWSCTPPPPLRINGVCRENFTFTFSRGWMFGVETWTLTSVWLVVYALMTLYKLKRTPIGGRGRISDDAYAVARYCIGKWQLPFSGYLSGACLEWLRKTTNVPSGTPWLDMLLFNPLKPELNPICYLLTLLGAHHFLHVSRIRVKLLTLRWLMSYIYGAPILDVSRSHTTTQHSR